MDRRTSRDLDLTFALLLLGMMSITSVAAGPPESSVRIIDVPRAVNTDPSAINDRGMITGSYFRQNEPTTGFMQVGKFLTDLKLHPAAGPQGYTLPAGINDRGEIVGYFAESFDHPSKAFVLSRGDYTGRAVHLRQIAVSFWTNRAYTCGALGVFRSDSASAAHGPSSTEFEFGGEYQFEASDDLAAIEHAHSDFDEVISLADQSLVIDEMERIVWENKAPKRSFQNANPAPYLMCF